MVSRCRAIVVLMYFHAVSLRIGIACVLKRVWLIPTEGHAQQDNIRHCSK